MIELDAAPARTAVIDLGSNTFRLVVMVARPGGGFRVIDELRASVRLGSGLGIDGRLTDGAIARALDTLERFADYVQASAIETVEVIGTSALRDAPNGGAVLDRADALGLPITVVAGTDEAELGVLAVANGFAQRDAWVMDLGGGSAQLSRMEDRRFVRGEAYPLGAVRLTEAHIRHDPADLDEVRSLEAAAAAHLGAEAERMAHDDLPLIVMGGSVRSLARAVQRQIGYPLEMLHQYWFPRAELEAITARLLAQTSAERSAISGIRTDRADILPAAAVVFRWLVRASRRSGLWVAGHGVREGAYYRRRYSRPPHLVDDVRSATVSALLADHPRAAARARAVRPLAGQVFDALAPLHGLETADRELLDAAAALHAVGLTLRYYQRQIHAVSLLRAVPLAGFDHRAHAMILCLVRYHEKGWPRRATLKPLLSRDDDKRRLLALAVCLRLAIALDRGRRGRLLGGGDDDGDAPRWSIVCDDEAIRVGVPDPDRAIEAWEVNRQASLVRDVFGCGLIVEAREA